MYNNASVHVNEFLEILDKTVCQSLQLFPKNGKVLL